MTPTLEHLRDPELMKKFMEQMRRAATEGTRAERSDDDAWAMPDRPPEDY